MIQYFISCDVLLVCPQDTEASSSNLSRRKSITLGNSAFGQKKLACNNDLKVIASSTNMTEFSRASLAAFQGKNFNASSKTDHSFSKSHGTLFDVQQKLTTLYRTIHTYNMKNSVVPLLTLDSNSNSIQISGTGTCDVDECIEGTSSFEDSNGYEQDINETQCVGKYSNCTTTNTNETSALSVIGMTNYFNRLICNNAGNSLNCTSQDDKIAANSDAEKDETGRNSQVLQLHSVLAIDAESISEYETLTEASEGLNVLEDPISASVEDALKLKRQILLKVEIKNSGIDDKEEYTLNGSETSSNSSSKQDNMKFESSILDIITEESSLSSCTEMKSDVHCCEIEEKNTFSQDKTLVPNEESKRTRSKIDQFSHEKVKKQKEGNCISNTESSNIRKFPSTFSSIFLLCNDQDTNHCQTVHDDSAIHDTKSSQDLSSSTESSSDVSVSRSINELIDNDGKSKNPDQSLEAEKMIAGGSTRNFEVSEEVKVPYSAIDLKNGTVISQNTVNINQTTREPSLDEAAKYTGVECLKEIKNVAKKFIDSVFDMKYKADHDRSKIQSNNGVSSKSSEIKFESYEINDAIESRNIDSIINKYESHSDSFATKKCMEWNSGKMKRYDTLLRLKEPDNTLDSCGCNNVQRTATVNLDYNNWNLSKAKSYSDLSTLNERQLQLTHRSRSYVNSGVITDERNYNTEKDYFFEPSSSSNNKLSDANPLSNSISDDLKDEMNIKKSKSCGSLCSKSLSNSIRILTSVKKRPIVNTMTINSSKRSYSINASCCELIPRLSHSPSESCIPLTKNKGTSTKNERTFLASSTDLSTNLLLGNETQDLRCQVVADVHERCSSSNEKENAYFQEYINLSEFEKLKNFERNAIEYYNLISNNRLISNYLKQKNLANTKVFKEPNVPDKVVCSQENNASLNSPEVINRSITCLLPDELSEQNPLNSLEFQNAIPFTSPYKIEKKETEVLVKPSTLDMSTSMTNFQSTHHLEESHDLNDVKIFEVSDELTKEECIRYLQMFDRDSNHDQSTNTYDFSDQISENI